MGYKSACLCFVNAKRYRFLSKRKLSTTVMAFTALSVKNVVVLTYMVIGMIHSCHGQGLSFGFYNKTCPNVETIVRDRVQFFLNQDITEAAGLLRLHFHDCFVQGCDGSVLLNSTSGEQVVIPNLSLRKTALNIINDIKQHVESNCSGVVSCADILALAARDSVRGAGGPTYSIPLGRRDSLTFANSTTTLANLPAPTLNVSGLMKVFLAKGFSFTDLVALSGGHTIGRANCSSFSNRLFNPTTGAKQQDPTLNQSFANHLYTVCPVNTTVNTTVNDIRTPNAFDNKYHVDLLNKQGLFTSDQDLHTNSSTMSIVNSYAVNQSLFFQDFVAGMVKMGNLSVLTGTQGQIRSQCWTPNSNSFFNIMEYGESDGQSSNNM